jgi:hypothetical protein
MLGGDLPCVVCRYNLRGLSIRSVCPECGTAVRATILALVDPHAMELEPLRSPRVTAAGLVAWMLFGLVAVALCWMPVSSGRLYGFWHVATVASVLGSAAGGLMLVRPHEGMGRGAMLLAAVGVLLYAPLAWVVWELTQLKWTLGQPAIYPVTALVGHERGPVMMRVLGCVLVAGIGLLLRPNARLLVARSLALRTGRVDRQTILGIVAACTIAAVGEVVLWQSRGATGTMADVSRLAGQILIPAGWALVTLGLLGSVIDAVRIARAIVMPSPSLGEVIGGQSQRGK